MSKVLKDWEKLNGKPAAEASEILICGGITLDESASRTFVNKIDSSVGTLAACERLSLSTNMIDKMFPLSGMSSLKILSLGRNNIKKIEKLDDVAGTLEQLWMSYNTISSLDGVLPLTNLRVLYMSQNSIKDWGEIEKLAALPALEEVLLVGNPIYEGLDAEAAMLQVIKRLPDLKKVDGQMVTDGMRKAAEEV